MSSPSPAWRLLHRFDPTILRHPGRRVGIYELSASTGSEITEEVWEDFDNAASLSQLVWLQGEERVSLTWSESALEACYYNTPGARDIVVFELPVNVDDALAFGIRIRLDTGTFLTLESVVDGRRWRHVEYREGTG